MDGYTYIHTPIYDLPMLNQDEVNNLNKPVVSNEVEAAI